MPVESVTEATLRKLRLANIRPYLEQHGWERRHVKHDVLAVFEKPSGSLDQILVPTNAEFDDFPEQMRNVVLKLAASERRSPEAVVNDLLSLDVDTLRFSVRSSATDRGALPLEEGLALIDGARKSLLAAACSVLAPANTYHPRMSRTEAEDLVRACELGQTEIGSYTVTIRCPMYASDLQLDTGAEVTEEVPFARRATETLWNSIDRLVTAIDQDDVDTALLPGDAGTRLTSNLCDALLKMQPSQETASLALSVAWAPSQPTRVVSASLVLRAEHFPVIATIGKQLRGQPDKRAAPFVAQVDELRGAIGEDGRRQGEVRLTVYHEDEAVKVRVNLDSDQYALADQAHMSGRYILVQGVLNRGPRISSMSELASIQTIEEPHGASQLPQI